jgi:dTDP-4-amino-4,6-dideoxygalactose transaminase
MINSKLALFGGSKIFNYKFKIFNTINKKEIDAVHKVLKSGVLSKFIGARSKDFLGGQNVKRFEEKVKSFFKVKYAVSVNSWTSGLICAVGSLDIEPGDEIILPTWTMSACSSAILTWNAIPVFADIEEKTFCISIESIKKNISKKTKAIIAVDIFGQSSNMKQIMEIAKKYNIKVISDSAQSPGAIYNGKYAGTLADIGGYSLNYHKHIHCGEGGILVTNNKNLAQRMRLIRNHAESVIDQNSSSKQLSNMVGYNFRLGEIESAIAIEQLKKLKKIIKKKIYIANIITKGIKNLEGLEVPKIRKGCNHIYYVYPIIVNVDKIGVDKFVIHKALKAEGLDSVSVFYQNLHLLPLFQKKIAYGKKGFPWKFGSTESKINYNKGICPIAEKLQDESFLGLNSISRYDLSKKDALNIVRVFKKVWFNLENLKKKY